MIRVWLATQLDRFINWIAPLPVLDIDWADELSEWEETHEVFEPDELWAAENLPAAESPLVGGGTASQIPPSVVPPEGLGIAQPRAQAFGLFNLFRNRG